MRISLPALTDFAATPSVPRLHDSWMGGWENFRSEHCAVSFTPPVLVWPKYTKMLPEGHRVVLVTPIRIEALQFIGFTTASHLLFWEVRDCSLFATAFMTAVAAPFLQPKSIHCLLAPPIIFQSSLGSRHGQNKLHANDVLAKTSTEGAVPFLVVANCARLGTPKSQ